jgi:hypothetical protein
MTTMTAQVESGDRSDAPASRYLTDGHSLYCVRGPLGGTDLWEIEDCRTLDVLLLPSRELHGGRLRPVETAR